MQQAKWDKLRIHLQVQNIIMQTIVVTLSILLLASSIAVHAARIDVDDLDYDQLMSMLAEMEAEDAGENVYEEAPSQPEQKPEQPLPQEMMSPAVEEVETNRATPPRNSINFHVSKPSASSVLSPHVEILRIIESFLALKGEMGTRIYALFNDNFDLFRSIFNLVAVKMSKLHSFTLVGITVVRKILEFAVQMMSTWEVSVPSVSLSLDKIFTNS